MDYQQWLPLFGLAASDSKVVSALAAAGVTAPVELPFQTFTTGVDFKPRGLGVGFTAEMKLPGVATLSFDLEPAPVPNGGSRLIMTARFRPRGLLGIAYWYSVLPLHGIVFKGMLAGLVRAATSRSPNSAPNVQNEGQASF